MLAIYGMAGCTYRKAEPIGKPMALNAELKNGQILYMMHCQKCHPQGEGGLGPAINPNPAPRFIKRFQARHGIGVMPSFKREEISEKDLHDLSDYLKALKHNEVAVKN